MIYVSDSQSALLGIAGAGTLLLRRGDIEAVAQGEGDTAGVIVLYLTEHHAITIEREAIDASIEKVIAWELDVKATFAEVLADTKRKDRICTVEIGIRAGVTKWPGDGSVIIFSLFIISV